MIEFFIRDDIISLGKDEDGSEIEGTVYYIVAEDENGRRWASPESIPGTILDTIEHDDGPAVVIRDVRDEAYVKAVMAQKNCEIVGASIVNDPEWPWSEIDPAYGSFAYQDQEAEIVARERHE